MLFLHFLSMQLLIYLLHVEIQDIFFVAPKVFNLHIPLSHVSIFNPHYESIHLVFLHFLHILSLSNQSLSHFSAPVTLSLSCSFCLLLLVLI